MPAPFSCVAGCDEAADHSAVACTARMTFMSKIIHGHGFIPMSRERAKANADHRARAGYVALYPQHGDMMPVLGAVKNRA